MSKLLDLFPSKEQVKEGLKNTLKFVIPRFMVGALLGVPYFAYSTKVALSSLSRTQIATAAGYYGAAGTMVLAVASKCYTWYQDRKEAARAAEPVADNEHAARFDAFDAAAEPAAPVLLSDSLRRVSPRRRAATKPLNVETFSGQSYR